jgi:hypothetical protein
MPGVALEQLAQGDDRRLCEALLTLHAIADKACAGLGVALDSSDGEASLYRVHGRELLARTGSLARVNDALLARVAKGPYTTHRETVVLALRLRARPRHRGAVAQDADTSPDRADCVAIAFSARVI